MLSRRTLELRPGTRGLPQPLIASQTLSDCGQANALLARARAQADELLDNAQQAARTLLQKAHDEFWQQANVQLAHWQQEHGALCQAIEIHASQVVRLALAQLLDEVPPPARIDALLRQLLAAQCPPVNATLRCHPQMLAPVRQWLSANPGGAWQLHTDERLDPEALVLVTAQHDLRIDWSRTLKALLAPTPGDGTDAPGTATES